ncbi:hypothetical protein [Nonomuraea aridisoli]|uniref:Uncharacterized protein n=1 Tax=Nonomuraea aridisoli TaxID=2070368 RepID=A0A2W2EB92_9ACTN|nr:hypothetical protein [Nonomuraea aridisoli]PZG14335.1 hypothetical protein C1J01_27310 [Nonomuraea aridisoli]
MSTILWQRMAYADLMAIGQSAIVHRLMKMAEETLVFPPREPSTDENWVVGKQGKVAWRRAVPPSGQTDDCDAAADYYIVYREPTDEEYRKNDRHLACTVMRVLHVSELGQLIK